MTITSNDLIEDAARHAAYAGEQLAEAGARLAPGIVAELSLAEDTLLHALAKLRAARWGITRRMPQYDDRDLGLLVSTEMRAMQDAHALIPHHERSR